MAPTNSHDSPAHIPTDRLNARRVRSDARASLLRRLAWTAAIVTSLCAVAVALSYGELRNTEAYWADEEAQREKQHPVSRYSLRALDAQRVEATFWRGTGREYSVVARAGRGAQARAEHASRAPAWDGVTRVAWSMEDSDYGDAAFTPYIHTAAHGGWVFATHEEPCGTGTITQWTLCSRASTESSRCIHAPNASACWQGPLHLVDLYETGAGEGRALWAVVERRMSDRTARMIAGVGSPALSSESRGR